MTRLRTRQSTKTPAKQDSNSEKKTKKMNSDLTVNSRPQLGRLHAAIRKDTVENPARQKTNKTGEGGLHCILRKQSRGGLLLTKNKA